jgi:hypothetical protein
MTCERVFLPLPEFVVGDCPDEWLHALALRARDCLGLEAERVVRKVHEAFEKRRRGYEWDLAAGEPL